MRFSAHIKETKAGYSVNDHPFFLTPDCIIDDPESRVA